MADSSAAHIDWRTSSRSGKEECVQVARVVADGDDAVARAG